MIKLVPNVKELQQHAQAATKDSIILKPNKNVPLVLKDVQYAKTINLVKDVKLPEEFTKMPEQPIQENNSQLVVGKIQARTDSVDTKFYICLN